MRSKATVETFTYEELLARIADCDEACWDELVRRDCSSLDGKDSRLGQKLRPYYERIRGAGRSFDDVVQELLLPRRKGEPSYLQKAIIDVKPVTEQDYLNLARWKFKQRLIDEARREAKHQIVVSLDANCAPSENIRRSECEPGLGTLEYWQSVRDSVAQLDEVEKTVTRLYYGLPETIDGVEPQEQMAVATVVRELEARGIHLTYEQAKEKLKKARRLLGIVLLPFKESLDQQ